MHKKWTILVKGSLSVHVSKSFELILRIGADFGDIFNESNRKVSFSLISNYATDPRTWNLGKELVFCLYQQKFRMIDTNNIGIQWKTSYFSELLGRRRTAKFRWLLAKNTLH